MHLLTIHWHWSALARVHCRGHGLKGNKSLAIDRVASRAFSLTLIMSHNAITASSSSGASASNANDILSVNPYESHPSLKPIEAEVLWEYAKLAHHVKSVCLIVCQFLFLILIKRTY
jgi:hypothetical protein